MNKSAYADDSPFGFLRQVNGKIAVLDLEDQGSMTFYHHVEEVCGVDYRYDKVFTGNYVDRSGLTELKDFSIYVRDIDKGVLTHVNPAGEDMWRTGIYKGDRPGEKSGLRTASAVDVFDYVKQIIDTGRAENMLFRYSKE
jgi:aminoglycoside 3-N-acetyltransferase